MTDLVYHRLTMNNVKRHVKKGQIFLGMGSGGQGYIGRVDAVTDRYVELTNGPHREIVYYNQRMIQFVAIDPPENMGFGKADSQLALDDG